MRNLYLIHDFIPDCPEQEFIFRNRIVEKRFGSQLPTINLLLISFVTRSKNLILPSQGQKNCEVQAVKLIILPLLFLFFLPDTCQAKSEIKCGTGIELCSGINGNDIPQISGIPNLLKDIGCLASDISSNTYDKKTYLRLLLHAIYKKLHPESHELILAGHLPPSPNSLETTDYYIYTLRKIII